MKVLIQIFKLNQLKIIKHKQLIASNIYRKKNNWILIYKRVYNYKKMKI